MPYSTIIIALYYCCDYYLNFCWTFGLNSNRCPQEYEIQSYKNTFIHYSEQSSDTDEALNVCPVYGRRSSTANYGLGKGNFFPANINNTDMA